MNQDKDHLYESNSPLENLKENVESFDRISSIYQTVVGTIGDNENKWLDITERLESFIKKFRILREESVFFVIDLHSARTQAGSEFFFNTQDSSLDMGYQFFLRDGDIHGEIKSENRETLLELAKYFQSIASNINGLRDILKSDITRGDMVIASNSLRHLLEENLKKADEYFCKLVSILTKSDGSRFLGKIEYPEGDLRKALKESNILRAIRGFMGKIYELEKEKNISAKREKEREKVSEVFSKEYGDIFDSLDREIGSYKSLRKIFALRVITYGIPFLLLTFHFCNVPDFANKKCIPCSWFFDEVRDNRIAVNDLMKDKKVAQNFTKVSTISNNVGPQNDQDAYLYSHLALVTILLLAFQQLRVAVRDMNIKKSLREIYRHRKLVSANFTKMYDNASNEMDKSAVIKSAARALFENEPSIYEKSQAIPPHVGEISNFIRH